MISLPTLLLLKRCLDAQQISAGDPNFAETTAAVTKAQSELQEAIQNAGPETS